MCPPEFETGICTISNKTKNIAMYLIGIEKIKTGNLDSGEYEEININIAITPADEPTMDIFNSLNTGNKY